MNILSAGLLALTAAPPLGHGDWSSIALMGVLDVTIHGGLIIEGQQFSFILALQTTLPFTT